MVFGLLILAASAGLPTTIGVAEGIAEGKKKKEEEKRTEDCTLIVHCEVDGFQGRQLHNKQVILRDDKLFVKTNTGTLGFPFHGFYMTYPNDTKPLGLVSYSSSDPPAMGFVYVDQNTLELKYGNRSSSMDHIVGRWDWTEDEEGLTLEDQEAFVAVREEKDTWAIYYDRTQDGAGLPKGKTAVPISMERRML